VQAACLATHPFAKIKKPTLRDLLKQPLILAGEATSSRMQFDHIVAKAGLSEHVNVRVTANNLSLILNYVVVGMGVALITRPAREATPLPPAAEKKLVFRDMSHILGHEQVVLLHPRGRHELAHVRAFREMVMKGLKAEA
jgi:DNA-binding transcriptional LysR family regulator